MPSKMYTVFVDDTLWTNVIDDMNTNRDWAIGGIIFSSITKAKHFCAHLRVFPELKKSKFEIRLLVDYVL